MRRQLTLSAAALVPLCGAVALCALVVAPPAAGQGATNMNGTMTRADAPQGRTTTSPAANTNSSIGPTMRQPARPATTAPPPAVRWSPVRAVPAFYGVQRVTIRAAAGARAAVVEEFEVHVYPSVEVSAVEGEFLRVRAEANVERVTGKGRGVEGWAEWGEVLPQTTALVLDAKTGRVLARHPLGHGIDSVSFSPDGKRALYHGQWGAMLYEADAADLAPARQLTFEGEGTFAPPTYVGTGHDLLIPFWPLGSTPLNAAPAVYAVRTDGGGVTVTPFARAPSGADPSRVVFAPDGRTGFTFYHSAYGDEEELPEDDERFSAFTVEVFDPLTLQKLRHFKAPSPALGFNQGSMAMNADGSELYLLDQTGQRLVVVETQAGAVVREVSLAGDGERLFSFTQCTVDAAGPRLSYWVASEEEHGETHALRLDGGRAVADDAPSQLVVEAGGTRYSVDEAGARLLTLDAEGRVVKSRDIPRRESDNQMPAGLFATPDGSRLVLILSVPEHGC